MDEPTASPLPEPGAVTDALLDTLAAISRSEATLYALRLELLHEIALDRLDAPWARATEAEIALATGSSEFTVNRWFGEASSLIHRLPATFERLRKGELTVAHAKILDRELCIVDDDAERAELETRLLKETHRTTNSFRRTVRQVVDRRHPGSAAERHQAAKERQDVWATPAPDGMGYLTAFMPAPEVAAVMERLDDLAHLVTATVPETSIGTARVDVLTSTLLGKTADGPRLGQVKTTAVITLPASTLTGGEAMGELEGFGPVDAVTARALASEATVFRKLLVDRFTGIRLTLGREQYRPTKDQRLWLRLRDRRCRFPGCNRPARRSELDHTIDWQYGGPTDDTNLAHVCERHHHMKHDTAWRVETDADGTLRFTSPAGRRYASPLPHDPDPPWIDDHLLARRVADQADGLRVRRPDGEVGTIRAG